MNRHKHSPRKLKRDLLLAVLVLSVFVITPVTYLYSQAHRDISEQFIDHAAGRAVGQFHDLTGSIMASLTLVKGWGESGLFTSRDIEKLNRLLDPVFEREKTLFAISIADADGNSYYVQPVENGLSTSQIDAGRMKKSIETEWGADFRKVKEVTRNSEYDPRQRPWFSPATTAAGIHWTEPYKFFRSGNVGVTASTAYLRQKDQKPVVVAFDILLDEIYAQIQKMIPSENGRIFVFLRDGSLYVPAADGAAPDFLPLDRAENLLAREAYAQGSEGGALSERIISFVAENEVWWGGLHRLNEQNENSAWLCVLVPEQDILSQVGERRILLWAVGLVTLVAATFIAFWFYRRYGQGDGAGSFNTADPEASIEAIIRQGEGRTIEFKSTMRMNLHTKKAGKEIELAWLKGVAAFLNTDGGILLLGVADSGEITGLEQDLFENEDKCKLHFKNLIAHHIGADLSKYIEFQLFAVNEKTVGVVSCSRSLEPVFLVDNKSESFYIRNGPSSDELPVSRALQYIKNRK